MLILGISNFEHSSAAALMGDAGLLAAIEEDKLSRTPAQGGLPHRAIAECLRMAQCKLSDVNLVAVASRPRHAWLRSEHLRTAGILCNGAAQELSRVSTKLEALQELQSRLGKSTRLLHLDHHSCHAASAYYASGFERALVLTLDQGGDLHSGLLAQGEGEELRPLRRMRYPNSLGLFYTLVTQLVGFRPQLDEHKTQWLGVTGEPALAPVFRKLFGKTADGTPVLKRRYLCWLPGQRVGFSPQFLEELGAHGSDVPPELRLTLASSAQQVLEEVVTGLAECWRQKTELPRLCVAGGVFLNVFLVRALERGTGFKEVYSQPVAGNPGTALGAAYLGWRRLGGVVPRRPLTHLNWGPGLDASQVKFLLDNSKIIYRFLEPEDRLIDEVVRLLLGGKMVAWYQGRTEFGLRALGNRTIVASPFAPYVCENLNHYLKHREDFHPFALSAPSEAAPRWFDCSPNSRFLSSVCHLRQEAAELERFAFRDRQLRVHVVERESNPRFWKLLNRFGAQAPAPVLVNTSFNLFGEPLVSTARDALRSFFGSGLDALAMGQFLVVKP
jgi:carbamoyltransferase